MLLLPAKYPTAARPDIAPQKGRATYGCLFYSFCSFFLVSGPQRLAVLRLISPSTPLFYSSLVYQALVPSFPFLLAVQHDAMTVAKQPKKKTTGLRFAVSEHVSTDIQQAQVLCEALCPCPAILINSLTCLLIQPGAGGGRASTNSSLEVSHADLDLAPGLLDCAPGDSQARWSKGIKFMPLSALPLALVVGSLLIRCHSSLRRRLP